MISCSAVVVQGSFWQVFFVTHRSVSGLLIILIYLLLISIVAFIFSSYIADLYLDKETPIRKYTHYLIAFFESLIGPASRKNMKFREYLANLIFFNAVAAVMAFVVIFYFNRNVTPVGTYSVNLSLAVHTVVSFVTNTDLQHYSNPFRFSAFAQTFGLMGLMLFSPVTGFAASLAFVRGVRTNEGHLGNFYHDFFVSLFDLFLPLTLLFTIFYALEGLPETLLYYTKITIPVTGIPGYLPLGPIASFQAYSTLGTNGAGFYGANAAFPLANPSWVSNITEFVAFTLIPLASILSLGKVFGNRRFGTMLYSVIMVIFLLASVVTFYSELKGLPSFRNLGILYSGNMLGKETYLGIAQSSVFDVGATLTSTGIVNSALIDYTPGGILGIITGLLMNDPLGGVGTSVINIFTYVIFTAFLASLLIGKLPEMMGFKLGSKEIKYSTLSLVTHPLIVLIPLGIILVEPFLVSGMINPEPQRVTELFYEFLTSASNNGSEIGGFTTNTALFNYLDSAIMLLGRYLILGIQLYIAQIFSGRSPRGESPNTVSVGSSYFGLMLFGVMIGLGLLSFFPVLALGPLLSFANDLHLFAGVMVFGH